MAKRAEPAPKRIIWNVYKIASKAVWLGTVEAADEAAAIDKDAAEFKVRPATDGDTAIMRGEGLVPRRAFLLCRSLCQFDLDVRRKFRYDWSYRCSRFLT
jgi:hypothetical protein